MEKDVKTKKIITTNTIPLSFKNAVECKLPILEEDVQNIIKLDAKASLNGVYLGENEVRYDGKVIFSALLGDASLKKCEMGVEFSYKNELKGAMEGGEVSGKIICENVRVQVNNGIPIASCAVIFTGESLKKEEIEYIIDADNLQLKKFQAENACVLETISKPFDLEDEFDLDFTVTEILWHEQNVKISDVVSSIGTVILSGELELNYLALNGDNLPILDKKTIPFSFEVDAKSAMPELLCEGSIVVKDCNLKVLVDETKNKSTVAVIVKLLVKTSVIENETISYIEDAFSKDYHLNLDKKTVSLTRYLGEKTIDKAINYKLTTEFEKNTLLNCPLFAKIEEIEIITQTTSYKASGVAEIGMLINSNGNYAVETARVPFDVEFEKLGDSLYLTASTIRGLTLSQAGSYLTVDFNVVLRVKETSFSNYNAVISIEEREKRVKSNSAISVFIPNCGDTLWDVCKSIGISEEELLKINQDLTFPTSGEERIIIYRELK